MNGNCAYTFRLQTILECADESAQARKSKISFFKPDGFRQSLLNTEDDQPHREDLIPSGSHVLNMDPQDAQASSPSDFPASMR